MSEAASAVCCRSNLPPAKALPSQPECAVRFFPMDSPRRPALALQLQTESSWIPQATWRALMALQIVAPINDQLADVIVRGEWALDRDEIGHFVLEGAVDRAGSRPLGALFRWKKGYLVGRHKHLPDAHTYAPNGGFRFAVELLTGDYDYVLAGVVHNATNALEADK